MQKKLAAVLAGAGLSASLLALAGPARAGTTGTWTVTPGGDISVSPAPLTKTIMWDHTRGRQFICVAMPGSGTAASGSGLSGSHILAINSLSFDDCYGNGTGAWNITMNGTPYSMNAASYDAATGVTTGKVSGFKLTISNVYGCVATVAGMEGAGGTVDATYTNSTHRLLISGNSALVVSSTTSGCPPTQIQVGDPFTLTTTLLVSPGQTITSP